MLSEGTIPGRLEFVAFVTGCHGNQPDVTLS